MAAFGNLAGTVPRECGRPWRNEDPPYVGRNAYELVRTAAPQEQFLERGGAIFPSNDSGSSFSHAQASRPDVERFAGATDPNMAWCWINRLEKFFDEMVYPNDKRIVWAAALLDGDAHYWWMSITQGYEEPSSMTWTKFLTHFFNKYINSGTRLATSSIEFQPLVNDVVSREVEIRSRLHLRDVDGPSQGPSKRATSDFVVKSRTSLDSSYVTVNHGGSSKRKKTHQQTPTKVAATLVRVEHIKQVAHMKCYNCGELGHISKDCTKPKNGACYKCGQSGHIANECTQPRRNKQGNAATLVRVEHIKQVAHMKCYNCGELGHISKDCTKPKNGACYKCGQSGHIANECTQPQRNKQGNAATLVRVEPIKHVAHMKCYNCSELGHISKDCTKTRNPACYKCGQSGHIAKECTQPQRNKQGN